jgi:multicomponent K+:H+ antiporter subunit A
VYLGEVRRDYPHHPHEAPPGLWLPVAVLLIPVLLIGVLPGPIAGALVAQTAQAVIGGSLPPYSLALWHGFTPALFMSLAAFLGAFVLLRRMSVVQRIRQAVPRPDAKHAFDLLVMGVVAGARRLVAALHTESLPRYMAIILWAIAVLGIAGFATGDHARGSRALLPVSLPAVVAFVALAGTCAIVMVAHQNRMLALIVTSVVGLAVSLAFIHYSAPDLALTQISVEVVATVLLLLALNLLPRASVRERGLLRPFRDIPLATITGGGIGLLAYAVMTRDLSSISDYHVAQSKPGGGGTNVVNVILVDFRGFDTFGEIIVLCVAAVTIYSLLDGALKGAAARRLASMQQSVEAADAHPLMLVVVTRVLLPLALTVGVYVFLRGHNLPGGGFIAGLIVAIALLMQAIASGHAWAVSRLRLNAHTMLGWGVLIAGLTGLGSFVFGRPFLTSTFGYVHLPVVGEFELASAMFFDLGVFLAVVGTVVLSLSQIARVSARAERNPVPEGPSDIVLRPVRGGTALPESVPASRPLVREG